MRGHAHRPHGRRGDMGDGEDVVAGPPHGQRRAARQARARSDGQGRDRRAVRLVQPGRGAQRRHRVHRRWHRGLVRRRSPDHREHDHRVGRARRAVPR